jgi:hypothetical protein
MRRTDLTKSIQKITTALTESNISAVIFPAREKVDMELLLSIFQTYASFSKNFSETERQILRLFNIEALDNPKFWAKLLGPESEKESFLKTRSGLRYFLEYVPAILNLLKQDHVVYSEEREKNMPDFSLGQTKVMLTVILPEQNNEISSPERLIKALESIHLLYSAFAIIENTDSIDLSVAAIDSGSDKSFDFLGAAKLMESVKELIIGLWDRVVFYREKKLSERVDLIVKSLPVIEKINEMEKLGSIGPEQAEILKRNIIMAANNFISVGAIIPEFSNYSSFDPRLLMTPEPKLLTNSTEAAQSMPMSQPIVPSASGDEISDEEIETMKKIIATRNKKND